MSIPEDKVETVGGLIAGMEKALTCTICLSQLNVPAIARCGHSFCKSCIENTIDTIGKCPICEESLTKDQIFCTEQKSLMVAKFNDLKESFKKEYGLDISQMTPIEVYKDNMGGSRTTSQFENSKYINQYHILQYNNTPISEVNIPNISFEENLDIKITHIVFDTDRNDLVKPNREYFLAILFGCYIVNEKWLKLCIEQNKMLPEARFEIQGDIKYGRTGAPSKARKNRVIGRHLLFKGLKVGLIGDTENEYYTYMSLGDADINMKYDDIIICSFSDKTLDELHETYKGKRLISKDWIDACICNFEIMKKDDYIL
ncbi:uncharacterized protein BX663DRAFT_503493 [Cokeromyces recurvatus]|uniref:uncharacterized protein n=1 Tax=Cokeromyces recurvatus TaxID=90255 RepID=UPI00221E539D|nr:uncharacterized protein BX663DRAFT_503493 [Cokeromyces recurvatus]KAI7904771.1 hypothetical protein BX663DRAFT_503493 [Cokeromyces recurvatus]